MNTKKLTDTLAVNDTKDMRQQRFAYPSYHAAKRISQRTSMDILQLMSLLDNDACVNIGQYAGSHRRHLLFFSPIDNFYYVAIQDERYGKIITVLPPAYHKNLAWGISPEQCQLAKQRYDSYAKVLLAVAQKPKTKPKTSSNNNNSNSATKDKYRTITTTPRTYRIWVQALYIGALLVTKRSTLFKISIEYYIDDFEKSVKELLKDPTLSEKIDTGIKKKRLAQNSIYALCFREKNNTSGHYILELRNQYDAEIYAQHREHQRQHMQRVLSIYSISCIALSTPPSMRLPRLCWHPIVTL